MHNITPDQVFNGSEMNKKLLIEFSIYEVEKENKKRKQQEAYERRFK